MRIYKAVHFDLRQQHMGLEENATLAVLFFLAGGQVGWEQITGNDIVASLASHGYWVGHHVFEPLEFVDLLLGLLVLLLHNHYLVSQVFVHLKQLLVFSLGSPDIWGGASGVLGVHELLEHLLSLVLLIKLCLEVLDLVCKERLLLVDLLPFFSSHARPRPIRSISFNLGQLLFKLSSLLSHFITKILFLLLDGRLQLRILSLALKNLTIKFPNLFILLLNSLLVVFETLLGELLLLLQQSIEFFYFNVLFEFVGFFGFEVFF